MEIFDIKLLGVSVESAQKLLLTMGLLVLIYVLRRILQGLAWLLIFNRTGDQVRFWVRQTISVISALLLALGTMSIWFEQAERLAAALAIITIAVGFALQRVILSLAGYFVILQSKPYRIGERVAVGDVRGDVIAIGFLHTTLMEMGEPTGLDTPGKWVRSRQYTGRVVTLSNAKVFEESVHNMTRDFPYVWEEISVPVSYNADRNAAETIIRSAAADHTVKLTDIGMAALETMQRKYFVRVVDIDPHVYYKITDNWLEMTVRFLAQDREIRELKDAITREILDGFDAAGIGVASSTYDIVGLPPIRVVPVDGAAIPVQGV